MKKAKTNKTPSEEYQRFEKLAKALISVPKSEIDKRQAEYQQKKEKKSGFGVFGLWRFDSRGASGYCHTRFSTPYPSSSRHR